MVVESETALGSALQWNPNEDGARGERRPPNEDGAGREEAVGSEGRSVGAKEPFQTTVKTPIASVKTMEWVA